MIKNLTRHSILAEEVSVARQPLERMKGLLGRKNLPDGHALIIMQCQSIHMMFMQFAIDVVFCNAQDQVVGLCADIKPFGFSPIFFKAFYAIELPAGTIRRSHTQVGDQLETLFLCFPVVGRS